MNKVKKKRSANGGSLTFVSLAIKGYQVYVFKKWVKKYGAPLCPVSKEPMVLKTTIKEGK